jgi:hypothetical protein
MDSKQIIKKINHDNKKGYIDENLTNEHLYKNSKLGQYVVGEDISDIISINLTTRPERKKEFTEEFKNFPFRFFNAIPNENPKLGCFLSHLECIKFAKKMNYKNILIMEDDTIIIKDLNELPPFPKEWDMIYLGGLCTKVKVWGSPGQNYIQGHYYCGHSYIVNNHMYDIILDLAEKHNGNEIDSFYVQKIHPTYKAYGLLDNYIQQREGWSDLDGKEKWIGYKWPRVGEMFEIP